MSESQISNGKNASPFVVVEAEQVDAHVERFDFQEVGDWMFGSSNEAGVRIGDQNLEAHHFTIERGPTYCLLKPLADVSLNGRKIEFPVLLANGDAIEAGEATFRYACPQDGNFPYLRIADTFWILNEVPEGWLFSPDTGFYRHLDDNFVENICFNQDEVRLGTLQQYLDQQFKLIAYETDEFSTKALQPTPLYRCEDCALHNHEFIIQGQRVGQYQYFALKNNTTGIASWTTPLRRARHDSAMEAFHDLLQSIYFG